MLILFYIESAGDFYFYFLFLHFEDTKHNVNVLNSIAVQENKNIRRYIAAIVRGPSGNLFPFLWARVLSSPRVILYTIKM